MRHAATLFASLLAIAACSETTEPLADVTRLSGAYNLTLSGWKTNGGCKLVDANFTTLTWDVDETEPNHSCTIKPMSGAIEVDRGAGRVRFRKGQVVYFEFTELRRDPADVTDLGAVGSSRWRSSAACLGDSLECDQGEARWHSLAFNR
jgi:hypothetical protein